MTKDATALSSKDVYARRFAKEAEFRNAMWDVLCRDWFQRYVAATDTVIEIAAGHCEFINHIVAARKLAIDINEETARHAGDDVEVIIAPSDELSAIASDSVDKIFVLPPVPRTDLLPLLSAGANDSQLPPVQAIRYSAGRLGDWFCRRDIPLSFEQVRLEGDSPSLNAELLADCSRPTDCLSSE